LVCRSHISYNKQDCIDAAAGNLDQIPYSLTHLQVRSLVQNALQSALRDANYPWASYELNHSLLIALTNEQSEASWLAGEDIFSAVKVRDISSQDMENVFDQLLGKNG
jgi:hypothetical protein